MWEGFSLYVLVCGAFDKIKQRGREEERRKQMAPVLRFESALRTFTSNLCMYGYDCDCSNSSWMTDDFLPSFQEMSFRVLRFPTIEDYRLLYEFRKKYRDPENGVRVICGTPEREHFFYGDTTCNEWLDVHPETVRCGLGTNVPRRTIERRVQLEDLKDVGDGTAAVRVNGYKTADPYIACKHPWEKFTSQMDRDIMWAVRNRYAPCSRERFLSEYLRYARRDMLIDGPHSR